MTRLLPMKRRVRILLAAALLLACLAVGSFYLYAGWYGFNVVFRRGGSIWISIDEDDPRISNAMRLALRTQPPAAEAGTLQWVERSEGLETAELAVIAEGEEVDRILLARISPANFRFEVRNVSSGKYDLSDWMKISGASLVVNGSYYARDGTPDTPFVSDSVASGPKDYQARHGAFVVTDTFIGVRDLHQSDWRELFRQAKFGMVSYPLLIGPGPSRVRSDRRWLANRTFVGQDSSGRIVIGTTKDAFFSLERLAVFLQQAPLNLSLALNLDGGPLACQGVAVKDFTRDYCGNWETMAEGNQIKLLRSLVNRRWGLPIVLVVVPK